MLSISYCKKSESGKVTPRNNDRDSIAEIQLGIPLDKRFRLSEQVSLAVYFLKEPIDHEFVLIDRSLETASEKDSSDLDNINKDCYFLDRDCNLLLKIEHKDRTHLYPGIASDKRFKLWQVENFASCILQQELAPRKNATISSLETASSIEFRAKIEREFIKGSAIDLQTSVEEGEQ